MDIVHKPEPKTTYEIILKRLRREFPKRKFRIKEDLGEVYIEQVGIEERVGFLKWRQLDLVAMGLLTENVRIIDPYQSGGGASVDSVF